MNSAFEDDLCVHCGKGAFVVVENEAADSYQEMALCGLCAIAEVVRRHGAGAAKLQPEPEASADMGLESARSRKF